jgi:2-octaprenyl-6-methoxyphenol hydroxylase
MERPSEIERLSTMTPDDFLDVLAKRLGGLLGALSNLGDRQSFPLSGLLANTMAQNRVALVGEAAHALPPIGAQGLNLGLVDAATLADHIAAARTANQDIGSDEVLAKYDQARRADVRRRAGAVDLLNRSLHAGLGPLNLARGAGLHVMAAMPSLRRRLMQEGLYPPRPLPSLMQVVVRDLANRY